MRRLWLLCAVLSATLLSPVAVAQAADVTITVGPGRTLTPSGSAQIDPDDSVTWQWAANSEEHHIVSNAGSAEAWNSTRRSAGSLVHTFVKSGAFAYTCLLHPDLMNGTITVTGAAPQAVFAPPTPAQPFIDDLVTFDASGSSDDVAIASYAWDFDGNGTFDETSLVPTTTHAYPTAGTFTARLRVTDDHTNTQVATQLITVRSRVPTASFTAAPATAAKNVNVAFDATASADFDGSITTYEWDLDGDGTFELSSPTPTTTRSYTAAGVVTVKLRVTDNDLRTAETTRTVTVTNAPPGASLTASTTTPANGAEVTFNASGSADTDGGTIASYAWDLDGDGVFETPGGTTPTITRAFTTAGPATVRVRVTDDEGATADAAVTITVAAPPVDPPPATNSPPPTDTTAPAEQAPQTASGQTAQPAAPDPVAVLAAPTVVPSSLAPPPAVAALTASGPAGQRLRRQRGVRVRVTCPAGCRLVFTGSVKVKTRRLRLTKLTRTLTAGRTTTLTLLVDRRDRKLLRGARGKAQASVRISSSSGGQTTTKRISVSLTS